MPTTLLEFGNQLANPVNEIILQYHSGQLTSSIVRDENGDTHVCLADVGLLRHVQQEIHIYQMDSTYDTTPQMQGQVQLFTWLGVYHDHASIFSFIID